MKTKKITISLTAEQQQQAKEIEKKYDMKPIVDLMDESIKKLKNTMGKVPPKHRLICSKCGQIIDMRDLSQVFAHEPCDGIQKDYNNIEQIPHSGSQKIGIQIFYTNKKEEINLN